MSTSRPCFTPTSSKGTASFRLKKIQHLNTHGKWHDYQNLIKIVICIAKSLCSLNSSKKIFELQIWLCSDRKWPGYLATLPIFSKQFQNHCPKVPRNMGRPFLLETWVMMHPKWWSIWQTLGLVHSKWFEPGAIDPLNMFYEIWLIEHFNPVIICQAETYQRTLSAGRPDKE